MNKKPKTSKPKTKKPTRKPPDGRGKRLSDPGKLAKWIVDRISDQGNASDKN